MPEHPHAHRLTGATRVRLGWFGRLILQVEAIEQRADLNIRLSPFVDRKRDFTFWRDAKVGDLAYIRYLDRTVEAKRIGDPPPPPPDRNAFGEYVC